MQTEKGQSSNRALALRGDGLSKSDPEKVGFGATAAIFSQKQRELKRKQRTHTLKQRLKKSNLVEETPSHANSLEGASWKSHGTRLDDFDILEKLGQGSFGTVLLVRHRKTSQLSALKIIQKAGITLVGKQIQHILNERAALQDCAHLPYCVHLAETFQDQQNLYFLFEYLPGGDFERQVKQRQYDASGSEWRFYLAEILCSLAALHERGILYRDLKPENILLDEQGHIRLIDFGFSKLTSEKNQESFMRASTLCGSEGYIAPEISLLGQRSGDDGCYDGQKSDIWSYGVLVCDLINGFSPFSNHSDLMRSRGLNPAQGSAPIRCDEGVKELQAWGGFPGKHSQQNRTMSLRRIMELVLSGQYYLPKSMPPLARDLVKTILQIDPGARPTIDKIKEHNFFKGIDWSKLANRRIKPPFAPENRHRLGAKQKGQSALNIASTHEQVSVGLHEQVFKSKQAPKKSFVLGDYHLQKINQVFKDF